MSAMTFPMGFDFPAASIRKPEAVKPQGETAAAAKTSAASMTINELLYHALFGDEESVCAGTR
jgi:hypothetical protein